MDLDQVRQSRGYHVLVGVGLVSYGLVHLLVAGLAARLAIGDGGDASSEGALRQLSDQPAGSLLLWVMAAGLFAAAVWQVVEATIGRSEPGRDSRPRRRVASVGRAIVYVGLAVLAVRVATGGGATSGQGQETLSARLMSVPFGRFAVAAIGLAVIGVGVAQIVKGVKKKFREDLDSGVGPSVYRFGTVGYCAKGVALAIIGGLFGWAAASYDPDKAGGMDQALSTIRDQPFGSVLLVAMAAGIACFGVYCFFWARHARY